jgi:hypothetical protein
MSAEAFAREELESFLARVRAALPAGAEAEDLIAELHSHLVDVARTGDTWDLERLRAAIARFGDPVALARECRLQNVARRAETTRTPWALLRFAAQWAGVAFAGARALVLGALGYGIAFFSLALAVAKPLVPQRIGLWLIPAGEDVHVQLGRSLVPPAGGEEVLGWSIVPIGLALAALAFFATTRYLVLRVRWFRARLRAEREDEIA